MLEVGDQATRRRMPLRSHSNFLARTATDDAAQLERRYSKATPSSPQDEDPLSNTAPQAESASNTYQPAEDVSKGQAQNGTFMGSLFSSSRDGRRRSRSSRSRSVGRRKSQHHSTLGDYSLTSQMKDAADHHQGTDAKPRPTGSFPRPVGGSAKLGTFAGVFVPTTLNVLSILMFLRFGFILGQSGVLGMMGMLIACYAINLVTTMSISAIATNGTVRGGGAYYLISRSLGPEFGGSIGIVFYLGFVFNTGMNAVGLIDCLIENFGSIDGNWSQWLPEGHWWQYLWATIVLIACTLICLAGSGLFARCSNGLLAVLLVSTLSIPFSTLIQKPFEDRRLGIEYTGLSADTFVSNLMPRFTKGAAGSQLDGKENFQDLFGILFPATGGIFAGASMSGDLKQPSKAIPKGTLYGLVLTFVSYTLVILAMAASITRASFYHNTNVIQIVNVSGVVVLLGEMATSLFSVLMGVIGSAKLLQALARDDLIPGLSLFGQGTRNNDEPTYAIIITYLLTQVTMLANINEIASFVTMSYLMTFLVTNLACFLLKISSAPNFRPSFHYFNWWTAAIGTIVSGATMFFVDGVYASACVAILVLIFVIIHYTTPPKPWGDVSQSLIYHQVRKYLLRLRQEHVKFWRPQILLFINDPRHQYKLIQFCNSLKKGALFVLGHVIVTPDFGSAVPEARSQQASWTKYIDFSKIKAFVNIAISPAVEWGARNIVLSAGLGGMRPNIVMMGFYNLNELRDSRPLVDVPPHQPSRPTSGTHTPHPDGKDTKRRKNDERMQGQLPTDAMRKERAIGAKNYVTILEDLLLKLQINVAIAKGFQDLELPAAKPSKIQKTLSMLHLHKDDTEETAKKYIDLWPIQMSAEIAAAAEGGQPKRNVLTTNFDTYTLILQLGCILHTVPSYHRAYKLRVIVFVEYESDVEEERRRVSTLLSNLRIEAKVIVLWLASGDLNSYEFIVNGKTIDRDPQAQQDVEETLRDEEWWQDVQQLRGKKPLTASQELADVEGLLGAVTNWPSSSFQHGRRESNVKRFAGLKKMLKKTKRRASISDISQMGVSLGMTTSRLHPALVHGEDSDSDTSTSGTGSEYGSTPQSDDEDSAASENDIEDYKDDESDNMRPEVLKRRSFSLGETMRLPFFFRKPDLQRRGDSSTDVSPSRPNPVQPHSAAASSEPTLPPPEPTAELPETSKDDTEAPSQASSRPTPLSRPPTMRRQSHAKFTSKPVPRTTVASEDGPGPSIMFTDTPSPADHSSRPHQSIYDRTSFFEPDDITPPTDNEQQAQAALGFPHASSVALSFNDLPCRAQHLILNELMRGQSGDTAVIFTTLPSPVEGTCESESDSVRYLSDLEVLCEGLPPVLLVHSNSMTVTMNL